MKSVFPYLWTDGTSTVLKWVGPKHWPVFTSVEHARSATVEPGGCRLVRISSISPVIWHGGAYFVRSDSIRALIVGHILWALSAVYSPIRRVAWRTLYALNMVGGDPASYSTWRDVQLPRRRSLS